MPTFGVQTLDNIKSLMGGTKASPPLATQNATDDACSFLHAICKYQLKPVFFSAPRYHADPLSQFRDFCCPG